MAVKVAILGHLPQELAELFADLLIALRQPISVHDVDLAHVGQSGELVQVPSLSFQFGQHLVQAVHPDDPLAQAAQAQVVCDGQAQLPRFGLDALLDLRRYVRDMEQENLYAQARARLAQGEKS